MKPTQHLKHILLLLEWYDYRVHQGVAQVAHEQGWHLICPKIFGRNSEIFQQFPVDGCISLFDCPDTLEYFYTNRIPFVDLGLAKPGFPVNRLVTDNREIGRLAAEHFLDRGYREVLAMPTLGGAMAKERSEALTHTMTEMGGTVRVLPWDCTMWEGLLRQLEEIAVECGQRLETLSVGLFAYDDYRAAELISLCLAHGLRVPENVAVLGVDNDHLINDGLSVGLSSIDSDQEGVGRAGAHLLCQLLEHPAEANKGILVRHPPKELVARQSTDYYAVNSPLVANALHWIHSNFHHAIQASDVAKSQGITQQGLQKAFKNNHFRTPAQEIRYQRAQAVAGHMMHSAENLETIAVSCGFNSVDSLINNFQSVYGLTPGQFRKAKRKGKEFLTDHFEEIEPDPPDLEQSVSNEGQTIPKE